MARNSNLQIRLFGGFHVRCENKSVACMHSMRLQELLAWLLLKRDSPQLRRQIAFHFWPDSSEKQARTNLRNLIYKLRCNLPDSDEFLHISSKTIQWNAEASYTFDVDDFEQCVRQAEKPEETGSADKQLDLLKKAVTLYQGDLFINCYKKWVEPERERLKQSYVKTLKNIIQLLEKNENYQAAIPYTKKLIDCDEYDEAAYRKLMELYMLTDNRPLAMQTYQECEDILWDELQIEPARETKKLYEKLHSVERPVKESSPLFSLKNLLAAPRDNTLAVLPLESISQNPEDVRFADGVHEELINRLAGIGGLIVIARSSVLDFLPENRNHQMIAKQLGVSNLVEGTVRRESNQLRVSVQLIDVESLRTIWSESYIKHVDNVFEIQSRIAREVAGELQATLTPDEQQLLEELPTKNPQAYHYYMQGREHLSRSLIMVEDNYLAARHLLLQAVKEDPEFAHAYAYLTVTYSYLYWHHGQNPEHLVEMQQAAESAFFYGPYRAVTYLAYGVYLYWNNSNYKQTLTYLEETLKRFPNQPLLHTYLGLTHRRLGNWQQTETHFIKSFELDPRNESTHLEIAWFYLLTQQYEKSKNVVTDFIWRDELFTELTPLFMGWIVSAQDGSLEGYEMWWDELHPQDPAEVVPFAWGEYNYWKRNWEEALRGFENIKRDVFWDNEGLYVPKLFFIANTYNAKGDRSKTLEYYEELRRDLEILCNKRPDDLRCRAMLGRVYARMGEYEKAVQEGENVVQRVPLTQNADIGSFFELSLAEIYAWTGKPDKSIGILEHLLSIPAYLHKGWLQLSPDWDPLRDHPRFQELISGTDKPFRKDL